MLRSLRSLRGSGRLSHSATLHSHASLHPHFASPGLCYAKPSFGLAKRHIQPERYVQCALRLVKNIEKMVDKIEYYKYNVITMKVRKNGN
jgi:hypothetical protein